MTDVKFPQGSQSGDYENFKEKAKANIGADMADLRDDASKLSHTVRSTVSEAGERVADKARDRLSTAADDLHSAVDTTRERLAQKVGNNPLATVVIALGLGVLLGRWLRR